VMAAARVKPGFFIKTRKAYRIIFVGQASGLRRPCLSYRFQMIERFRVD
jgi:hypothetical protein